MIRLKDRSTKLVSIVPHKRFRFSSKRYQSFPGHPTFPHVPTPMNWSNNTQLLLSVFFIPSLYQLKKYRYTSFYFVERIQQMYQHDQLPCFFAELKLCGLCSKTVLQAITKAQNRKRWRSSERLKWYRRTS